MAYISAVELRTRLPVDGQGISDSEIGEALASAIEYVAELTGDVEGASAVSRGAAADFAHADLLDIIYPRDARSTNAASVILRQNAEALLSRYLKAKADNDNNPTTVPSVAYIQKAPF